MARLWGEVAPVPEANLIALAGGEEVEGFRVEHVPGHASHHLCYLDLETGDAYVGDMAGVRIPPGDYTLAPTPPPEIDVEAWLDSVDRIEALRARARCGSPTSALAEDVGAQLERVRESLRRNAELRASSGREAFLAALRGRDRRPRGPRDARAACARRRRPSSSGSASSATGASATRPSTPLEIPRPHRSVRTGVQGCSAATLPRSR